MTLFSKNLNQKSLTPRWSLTPCLLRSHVWLYSRVVVSKSYENTSKYVDTVTLFSKTRTKGHWPLDDLWAHVCWGHMCDSTQGSLCPSPMGIHQCMWIQWSILQNDHILHTTYYILHTYYVQNEWSHSLLLNSVQARQKLYLHNNTPQYKLVEYECTISPFELSVFRKWNSTYLGSHYYVCHTVHICTVKYDHP